MGLESRTPFLNICPTSLMQRQPDGDAKMALRSVFKSTYLFSFQTENISKDLYIEVYPGTYSVTVGSSALSKKTHVVAVDPGQSVDLVFPV